MEQKNRPFAERLGFAWNGMRAAWRDEPSFRWQAAAAALVVALLLYLRPAPAWWAIFLVLCALVPAAELFNTSIERVIDRLHPEFHPDLEVAKDCAAAAVLLLSIGAVAAFAAFVVDLCVR